MEENDVEDGYEEGKLCKIVCPKCLWVSDEGAAVSFGVCDEEVDGFPCMRCLARFLIKEGKVPHGPYQLMQKTKIDRFAKEKPVGECWACGAKYIKEGDDICNCCGVVQKK